VFSRQPFSVFLAADQTTHEASATFFPHQLFHLEGVCVIKYQRMCKRSTLLWNKLTQFSAADPRSLPHNISAHTDKSHISHPGEIGIGISQGRRCPTGLRKKLCRGTAGLRLKLPPSSRLWRNKTPRQGEHRVLRQKNKTVFSDISDISVSLVRPDAERA